MSHPPPSPPSPPSPTPTSAQRRSPTPAPPFPADSAASSAASGDAMDGDDGREEGRGGGDGGGDGGYFLRVLAAFVQFPEYEELELQRRERHLGALREEQRKLIPVDVLLKRVEGCRACLAHNAAFLWTIASPHVLSLPSPSPLSLLPPAHPRDLRKVGSVLTQFAREWSEVGAEERKGSIGKCVDALVRHVTPGRDSYVCVPGSGLGRTVFEVAKKGYAVQGCEFSLHMLLGSEWVLNHCDRVAQATIAPYISSNSNHWSEAHQTKPARIPDECPALELARVWEKEEEEWEEEGEGGEGGGEGGGDGVIPEGFSVGEPKGRLPRMSMASGEFLEIYNAPTHAFRGQWSAVVSVFFIDTAPVLSDYIVTIWNMLKPGGVWINLGPLLYHWEKGDVGDDERHGLSVELTYEEAKIVVEKVGFEFLEEEQVKGVRYATNEDTMMKTVYDCAFFVAKKKEE